MDLYPRVVDPADGVWDWDVPGDGGVARVSLDPSGYFSVYLVSRTQNRELYLESQADLDLHIGVFNTIALLLSSWAIARCVQAARAGAYRSAMRNAYLTIFFGLVFLVSKILEWIKEIRMGNTFTSNEFF